MNKHPTTKDELFILKLYQMSLARGGPYEEIDRYAVAQAIGQNNKGADNIVNLLAQANFIRKGEGSSIYLTDQGIRLVAVLQR